MNDKESTHLIMERTPRTIKCLFAMAGVFYVILSQMMLVRPACTDSYCHLFKGKYIVDPAWIYHSLEAGYLVAENEFEITFYAGAKASRRNREEGGTNYRLRILLPKITKSTSALEGWLSALILFCVGKQLLDGLSVFVGEHDNPDGNTIASLAVEAGAKITKTPRNATVCLLDNTKETSIKANVTAPQVTYKVKRYVFLRIACSLL